MGKKEEETDVNKILNTGSIQNWDRKLKTSGKKFFNNAKYNRKQLCKTGHFTGSCRTGPAEGTARAEGSLLAPTSLKEQTEILVESTQKDTCGISKPSAKKKN